MSLEIKNLTKTFDNRKVLNDISFKVENGQTLGVVGFSGSGKSTFLRCLNCIEDLTSGQILFNGIDIADMKVDINVHRQKMGMVFQHFNLFNNIWNTNFPMWYEDDARFRFVLSVNN